MARLQELDFAEVAFFVELLEVKKLAGIDDGFHHDVFFFRLPHEVHDFPAVLDAGRHRHGAGDVFAGLERGDRLPGVIGNGGIDVDRVEGRVFKQLVEIVVPVLHAKRVADRVQFFAGALADGVHVGAGVPLVDGNELRAKAQPNNGDVNLSLAHASRVRCRWDRLQKLPGRRNQGFGSALNHTIPAGNCQRQISEPTPQRPHLNL